MIKTTTNWLCICGEVLTGRTSRNHRCPGSTEKETDLKVGDRVKVTAKAGYFQGVAFRVLETHGVNMRVVMIGDDEQHWIDRADLERIDREEYCGVCGQIGCGHDGLVRE